MNFNKLFFRRGSRASASERVGVRSDAAMPLRWRLDDEDGQFKQTHLCDTQAERIRRRRFTFRPVSTEEHVIGVIVRIASFVSGVRKRRNSRCSSPGPSA